MRAITHFGAALLLAPLSFPAEAGTPLPEANRSTIGYPTVEAALTDLRSKAGVEISTENGWLVAVDQANLTIWSFAPMGHAAYPAAVKRQVVQRGAGSHMTMSVQCESTKAACDDLVRTFEKLNDRAIGG